MPRLWKIVFRIEIVICLATAAYWAIAPDAYLRALLVDPPASSTTRYLTIQSAGLLACAWGYLYARLLHARPFQAEAFARLQEAMAIGDVIVLVVSLVSSRELRFHESVWAAQIAMAALWLAIRLAYLARRGRSAVV
jgi:hypothetical protein